MATPETPPTQAAEGSGGKEETEELILLDWLIQLPSRICADKKFFDDIFSVDTWNNVLKVDQKKKILQYLPPEVFGVPEEAERAMQSLVEGPLLPSEENENPLERFFDKLVDKGHCTPEVAEVKEKVIKVWRRETIRTLKKYHTKLLHNMILNRCHLLQKYCGLDQDNELYAELQRCWKNKNNNNNNNNNETSSPKKEEKGKKQGRGSPPPPHVVVGKRKARTECKTGKAKGPKEKMRKLDPDSELLLESLAGLPPFSQAFSFPSCTVTSAPASTPQISVPSKSAQDNPMLVSQLQAPALVSINLNQLTGAGSSSRTSASNSLTLNYPQPSPLPLSSIPLNLSNPFPTHPPMPSSFKNLTRSNSCVNFTTSSTTRLDISTATVPSTIRVNNKTSPISPSLSLSSSSNCVPATAPYNAFEQASPSTRVTISSCSAPPTTHLETSPPPLFSSQPSTITSSSALWDDIDFSSIDTTIGFPIPSRPIPNLLETTLDDNDLRLAWAMDTSEPLSPSLFDHPIPSPSPFCPEQPELLDSTPDFDLVDGLCDSYFSLLRNIICSTPDHRITFPNLQQTLLRWSLSPAAPLNPWYPNIVDWTSDGLVHALRFLAGRYTNYLQPRDDFVPYLVHKRDTRYYQWIGAGRDGDHNLTPLCLLWLDHLPHFPMVDTGLGWADDTDDEEDTNSDKKKRRRLSLAPPPPRCPTQWVMRPSTDEERTQFRAQERQRFDNPFHSFTYKMHGGYESVVGPVRNLSTTHLTGVACRAREHSLMIAGRPSYITISTLVTDAVARLPNGEGTRNDIVEMLKDSVYLRVDASEQMVHNSVSSALDRLHTEEDPCVVYDSKRKGWIYLHRDRGEEQFERQHMTAWNITKPTRRHNGKRGKKPITAIITTTEAAPPTTISNNEPTCTAVTSSAEKNVSGGQVVLVQQNREVGASSLESGHFLVSGNTILKVGSVKEGCRAGAQLTPFTFPESVPLAQPPPPPIPNTITTPSHQVRMPQPQQGILLTRAALPPRGPPQNLMLGQTPVGQMFYLRGDTGGVTSALTGLPQAVIRTTGPLSLQGLLGGGGSQGGTLGLVSQVDSHSAPRMATSISLSATPTNTSGRPRDSLPGELEMYHPLSSPLLIHASQGNVINFGVPAQLNLPRGGVQGIRVIPWETGQQMLIARMLPPEEQDLLFADGSFFTTAIAAAAAALTSNSNNLKPSEEKKLDN